MIIANCVCIENTEVLIEAQVHIIPIQNSAQEQFSTSEQFKAKLKYIEQGGKRILERARLPQSPWCRSIFKQKECESIVSSSRRKLQITST
jgi:hypothetical protein